MRQTFLTRYCGLLYRAVIAAAVLIALSTGPSIAQKRIALVVGNNNYANLSSDKQLRNAVNDARLMRDTLRDLGFDVLYGENLDRRSLVDRLFDLTSRAGNDDIVFFFFAGHGVSFSGANYLLPSDVPAPRATGRSEEGRLAEQALAETVVIERLTGSGARVAVVVLDACRDNPLQAADRRSVGGTRGLAQGQPARGVFSIYSAGFGQTALDRLGPDDASPNSVFTRTFAEKLKTPGLDLRAVATQTRVAVVNLAQKIGHDQFPAYYDQVIGDDIVFSGAAAARPTAGARDDEARQVWSTVQNTGSPAILEDFIRQFGSTAFGSLARARLDEIRKTQTASATPTPPPAAPKNPPVKIEITKAARDTVARNFSFFDTIVARAKRDYVEVPDEAKMMRGAIEAMHKAFPPKQQVSAAGNQPVPAARAPGGADSKAVLTTAAEIVSAGIAAEGEAKIFNVAVNGMLTALDPHSSYLDPKAYKDMQTTTRGVFGGVGLELTMDSDKVKVVAPIDGSPGSRADIRSNDLITHVDGKPLEGLTLMQVVERIRGPIKTNIVLRISRPGGAAPFDVSLTRDTIRVQSVRWRIEKDTIGYIRITQFNEQTTDLFRKALAEINGKIGASKVSGYVLDMRNNPGGLLDQAISISDEMLEWGEIVSTRGRTTSNHQKMGAKVGDAMGGKPIVVLVNGGSASASEIVAGALQDHKRAQIIGSRSFGKGSVQTIIPLGEERGALRLTTARYYTPSGRSIQAAGIVPDIEVLQDEPEDIKKKGTIRGEASLKGHLPGEQEEVTGSQSYIPPETKDDKALHKAFELLGRP